MDDTYLWSHDREHLQRTISELEVRLVKDGLYIHPTKTAIKNSEPTGRGGSSTLGVPCQPFGTVITALGSPIDLPGTRRGHQSFREALQTPVCTHPIKGRLRMHTTMVRNAALWAGQAWPITESLQPTFT